MKQSFDYIRHSISHLYPEKEADSLAYLVLEHVTQFSRDKILTNKNTILSEKEHQKIHFIVERLKKEEPLQYILGETFFYDLPFYVNEHTLIPRPETEELVDWVVAENKQSNKNFLDIGTGSGCIAVSLAKNIPDSRVAALDVSAQALELAKKNAIRNQVEISFLSHDILSKSHSLSGSFDVIVSNPPYVCEKEKPDMRKNVLDFEPHTALFVSNEDPLLFYRSIALFATSYLNKGGALFFEINRAFGTDICSMLDDFGFSNIELRKDLCGNDRMIRAQWL
jgi:release factor glutamine methyltransferase